MHGIFHARKDPAPNVFGVQQRLAPAQVDQRHERDQQQQAARDEPEMALFPVGPVTLGCA